MSFLVIFDISEHNIPSIKSYELNGFIKTNTPYKKVRLEAMDREDRFFLYERLL